MFGCDAVYQQEDGCPYKTNWGYPVLVILNLVVMLISYGCVLWKFRPQSDQEAQVTTSLSRMLLLLSFTYAVCILPAMTMTWGLWAPVEGESCQPCTGLYWCMYGRSGERGRN